MQTSVRRLAIVALICFFPLAAVGLMNHNSSPRTAIRYYKVSIMICTVFFVCLALYTYARGGNFIKVIGTFY